MHFSGKALLTVAALAASIASQAASFTALGTVDTMSLTVSGGHTATWTSDFNLDINLFGSGFAGASVNADAVGLTIQTQAFGSATT
jgi:hypothetical protein